MLVISFFSCWSAKGLYGTKGRNSEPIPGIQEDSTAAVAEAVQKWQKAAHKAQRHADACFAEAQAKEDEAAEATAQVGVSVSLCVSVSA